MQSRSQHGRPAGVAEHDFLTRLVHRHPRITLIGMSGLGKSHWSKKIESHGFRRYCCDNMIEAELAPWLIGEDGAATSLGKWMGMPFDDGYGEREARYLSFEVSVLQRIVARLESADPMEKIVVDTTGSAPYAGDDLMERLRRRSHVVLLDTSEARIAEMLRRYLDHPRPVLWGGIYDRRPDETQREALERSYRELIRFRQRMYRQYAHVSIPFEVHRGGSATHGTAPE